MTSTPIVAWLALFISVAALALSIFNSNRDRARLRVSSIFVEHWEGFTADIKIEMVNAGRRPIILTMVRHESTLRRFLRRPKVIHWSGEHIEGAQKFTLGERESHTVRISWPDVFFQSGDDIYFTDDMAVIDTLGNRHQVKGIRKNLSKLDAWMERQKIHKPAITPIRSSATK